MIKIDHPCSSQVLDQSCLQAPKKSALFFRCSVSGVGVQPVPVHASSQSFILELLLGVLMSQTQSFSSSSIASLESLVAALMRDAKTEADEIGLFRQLSDRGLLQAALEAALRDPEVSTPGGFFFFAERVLSQLWLPPPRP